MAKDDYNYIVFRILIYLYAVLKRKQSFDKIVFIKSVVTEKVSEEYLTDILRMMSKDGLIEGLAFMPTWGKEYILICDYKDMSITSSGISYLEDNSTMRKIKEMLLESTGAFTELVKIVFGI